MEAGGRAIGEVLSDQAKIHGSDLIVMGAYGRSRIREFILGGATKAMPDSAADSALHVTLNDTDRHGSNSRCLTWVKAACCRP